MSHIKYAVENKDTDVSFYFPSEMETSNIRYRGCLKPIPLETAAMCKTVVEAIQTDMCGCNCYSYNSKPLNNTEFYLKIKDRKIIPATYAGSGERKVVRWRQKLIVRGGVHV